MAKRVAKQSTKTTVRRTKKSTVTRRSKQQKIDFQGLETRQMMSTVSVAQYGHDANALQQAINASGAGDTILFNGGTYNFGSTFELASNRTYLGQNGATISGSGAAGEVWHISGDNVTVKGLTFNIGGVKVDRPTGMNQNILFDTDRFNLSVAAVDPSGITFTSGLQNSTITNCYFTGYGSGRYGIYGYNYLGLNVTHNSFVNIVAGMHIDAFGGCGNLLVQANYETGIQCMGFEFQGKSSNDQFLDNWYENPNLSSNFVSNNNSQGFSLILDQSSNITIARNTVIAPQRPDGVGCRIAFELGGDNTNAYDNYINGVNQIASDNDGTGTSSVTFHDNNVSNYLEGAGQAFGAANRTWSAYNNSGDTTLSWDIHRGLPGANSLVGGTATGIWASGGSGSGGSGDSGGGSGDNGGDDNGGGTTTIDPITAPTGLSAVSTGDTTVNLFWTDNAINETKYVIYDSTDGSTWNTVGNAAANAQTYSVTGLTEGTKYSFKVVAFNAQTNSQRSNVDTATPADPHLSGTYISDLQWTSSTNGWGDAERDRSNGEQADGDGNEIAINGTQYAKGVGVHANSEINVALNGKYSTFTADIGLDDETGGLGSVVFQVWADGTKLFDSGTITANLSPKTINVDTTGALNLKLVVLPVGTTNDYDHADWGNARLKKASDSGSGGNGGTTNGGGGSDNTTTYLSELAWSKVSNGWGPVAANKSVGEQAANDGHTLSIAGKTYTSGLGVNSYSEIHYTLNGKYGNFITDIGVDDEVGAHGSVDFQVWTDGVKLYDSGTMTGGQAAQSINVNVEGRNELVLIVTDAGDGNYFDHADWANARLTSAPRPQNINATYVSDLKGKVNSGTAELDSALGDDADGGDFLTIAGRTYGKGLGVSGGTKLSYNLNGKYDTFITDLGIDDEVGNSGSVTFQIWGDGTKLYDSGIVTGKSGAKSAEVLVGGVKQLWLVVTDAGDGKAADHADWANARLIAA